MTARRFLAATLLSVTAGCSSLSPVSDPFRFINETRPPLVYVTYETGAIMMLENPTVGGDSLRGTRPGDPQQVALPVRQVQRVATVRFNGGRTALLVAGLGVAAGVVTYAVLGTSSGKSNFACDYNEPKRGETVGAPTCGFAN
jgi:hypothetical protein